MTKTTIRIEDTASASGLTGVIAEHLPKFLHDPDITIDTYHRTHDGTRTYRIVLEGAPA